MRHPRRTALLIVLAAALAGRASQPGTLPATPSPVGILGELRAGIAANLWFPMTGTQGSG
jgi:hypothetical protein